MTDIEKIRAESIRRNSGNDDTQGYAWGWAIPTLIREVDRTRWQPIETVPRDGSRFLVHEPFEPTVESAWINEDGELTPCSNRAPFWKTPTHWMPIPADPISR